MSRTLLGFARAYVDERLSAVVFSEAYIELWRIERDSGVLLLDPPELGECLSSIFCAADMYCWDDDLREPYEFDDEKLKLEVASLVSKMLI
jgi:hypothetical protein